MGSFLGGGDAHVVNSDCGNGCMALSILTIIELYT